MDVPRCGALSLLQKTPHYRGGRRNCYEAERKIVQSACVVLVVTDWWHLTHFLAQSSSTRKLKADAEIKSRQIGVE
jgi:hypothetical protein